MNHIKKLKYVRKIFSNHTLTNRLRIIIWRFKKLIVISNNSLYPRNRRYVLEATNINPSYALILSSIIFGQGHGEGMKLSATCVGYLWANIDENNGGSLWASIAGHITLNAIGEISHYYQAI